MSDQQKKNTKKKVARVGRQPKPARRPTAPTNDAIHERSMQNDSLAYVLLMEGALISFRGHYLRHDAIGMLAAIVEVRRLFTELTDAMDAAMSLDLPAES